MHSAYQQLFAAWLASVFLSIFARVLSSHLIMFSLLSAAYCPPFGLVPPQTRSVGWCDYTLFAAASHCPKVQFAKTYGILSNSPYTQLFGIPDRQKAAFAEMQLLDVFSVVPIVYCKSLESSGILGIINFLFVTAIARRVLFA